MQLNKICSCKIQSHFILAANKLKCKSMANTSCGCTGIRYCYLCENGRLIRRSNIMKQEPEGCQDEIKLFHYCLHSKVVKSGPWANCPLPSCYSKINVDSAEITLDECSNMNGQAKGDMIKEMMMLHNEIVMIENFISTDEELDLRNEIYKLPWKDSQSGRRKQDFGPKANFKKRKAKIGKFNGLPSFSRALIERMQSMEGLKNFVPVEVCHLEYARVRGSSIDPHIDDDWLWGERLVTLSLCSTSVLSLTNDMFSDITIQIPMPACSLLILQGSARHIWKHSIKRNDIDDIRLAVTFRELSMDFLQGNEVALGRAILEIASEFNGKPLYAKDTEYT